MPDESKVEQAHTFYLEFQADSDRLAYRRFARSFIGALVCCAIFYLEIYLILGGF